MKLENFPFLGYFIVQLTGRYLLQVNNCTLFIAHSANISQNVYTEALVLYRQEVIAEERHPSDAPFHSAGWKQLFDLCWMVNLHLEELKLEREKNEAMHLSAKKHESDPVGLGEP